MAVGSDDLINEMKSGISYSARKIFWAKYIIPPEVIAFSDGQRVEAAWHEVDRQAAQNIFEMVKDGELYCLRVKRYADIKSLADFQDPRLYPYPRMSIGYEGTLSKVHMEPRRVPVSQSEPSEAFPMFDQVPTWAQIRRGIGRRLAKDFKPNALGKWFIKNILARVLYLPEQNPKHWGMDD